MDFTKFVSLLESKSLFFSRADKLAEADPYEGLYSSANIAWEKQDYAVVPQSLKAPGSWLEDKKPFADAQKAMGLVREFAKLNRDRVFANCWHIDEHESAATWKVYISGRKGVAIKSTVGRLKAALSVYHDYSVHIGSIQYVDYQRFPIPQGNLLSVFLFKRKSFQYESELRALIWTPENGKDSLPPADSKYRDACGILVPVDLNELLDAIFVSPKAEKWFSDLVASVAIQYAMSGKRIEESDLSKRPLY